MTQSDAAIARDADAVAARVLALPRGAGRRLVAIAGAPASGKSTLADAVCRVLRARGVAAETVPMDGFHLDNAILDRRGLRARKGAPETFDSAGFVALVARIRSERQVIYPLFDRGRDLAIAGAGEMPAGCEVAVFEGNYLLFDEAPWSQLAGLWDLSVWFDTPEEVLLERCVRRWLDHGHTPEAARARALGNDIANARRIVAARLPADMVLGAG